MLGIDDFKQMPHYSSIHLSKLTEVANAWADAAEAKYKDIFRFSDMKEHISHLGLAQCRDNLAAIRQIEAAMVDVAEHFSQTLAKASFEYPHNRVKESLRKATRDMERLATYFER